jgi:hypothetical protein
VPVARESAGSHPPLGDPDRSDDCYDDDGKEREVEPPSVGELGEQRQSEASVHRVHEQDESYDNPGDRRTYGRWSKARDPGEERKRRYYRDDPDEVQEDTQRGEALERKLQWIEIEEEYPGEGTGGCHAEEHAAATWPPWSWYTSNPVPDLE